MAIGAAQYRETNDLASANKTFYPVRIPVSHWQLRHYISTSEPDLLYYASSHDIFCLNTVTKKRKHIATLPFEARCTASGYGWVCVGGEEMGHFAAIKLDGSGPRTLDVDSALPLGQWRSDTGRRAASIKVERMGEDIVNSISIHRVQDEDIHLDDIVAILTNNDKTVRMYSLPQNLETTVLDLPFPMNHATVSPDGKTLLAVGDFNQAYFYERHLLRSPPQIHKPHNRLTSASIKWEFRCAITLHVSEPIANTGYFTTAWSPSGQLVAVGSEGGYITVFDVGLLPQAGELVSKLSGVKGVNGVVSVIPSSRPDWGHPHPGAVRSMIFSPEPWDLLIWAEDQDRICVSDLRTGLETRQVIKLDPKEEGLNSVAILDAPGDDAIDLSQPPRDFDEVEADFIRRYRYMPDNATAVNFATEYIEARRRQRQQRHDAAAASLRNFTGFSNTRESAALDDRLRGLTAREEQILESLRTTRQREEARASGETGRTINYTSSDMFHESGFAGRASTTVRDSVGEYATRSSSDALSSAQDAFAADFPELARSSAANRRPGSSHGTNSPSALQALLAQQEAVRARMQRSETTAIRPSDSSRLPRRRASVVLTPPDTNSHASSQTGTANISTTPPTTTAVTARPPSASAETEPEEEENPWRTIEEHMTLARGPLFESAQRTQAAPPLPASTRPTEAELQADLQAERARARALTAQRDRLRQMNAAEQRSTSSNNNLSPSSSGANTRIPTLAQQGGNHLRRELFRSSVYSTRDMGARGVRTAGLAMSADGRTLWAACEAGIFEIAINVKNRFFWPSVEPR